jgi:hypothetical protein
MKAYLLSANCKPPMGTRYACWHWEFRSGGNGGDSTTFLEHGPPRDNHIEHRRVGNHRINRYHRAD